MTRCCEVVQNGARAASPETESLHLRQETRDLVMPQAVGNLGMAIGALHLTDGFPMSFPLFDLIACFDRDGICSAS
jgi:hypothetical protein